MAASNVAMATPPPPSPGIPIAKTSYDVQHYHSSGYQVGRLPGADIVHLSWMHWNRIPIDIASADRFVHYNSYTASTGTLNQGFNGCQVSLGVVSRGGYSSLDVGSANDAYVFEHQRDESFGYLPFFHWLSVPGDCFHIDNELATTSRFGQLIYAQGTVKRHPGGADIVHELAHSAENVVYEFITYWRSNGTIWEGPVAIDSNPLLSYIVTADENSDKVAVVLHTSRESQFAGTNNVAYFESTTEGAGWISGAELGDANKHFVTSYTDTLGPQAWRHISAAYDHNSVLQIVWDERLSPSDRRAAIRHWNDTRQTIVTVAIGNWPTPYATGYYDLNLAKITLGIGDGATLCAGGAETNENYLYVLYTRFAGPTVDEQADHSALGYYNGELYLNVSPDGGENWSAPFNLTDTKTPGCNPGPGTPQNPDPPFPDSVCRSEHWATIGQDVHDIDIFFISDLDAGGIVFGEGTWQLNPVHYYRIPGGTANAPYVCPVWSPVYAATLSAPGVCGFHASGNDADSALLIVSNRGNTPLQGRIDAAYTPPSPPLVPEWLTVNGAQSDSFALTPLNPEETLTVRMDASGLPQGAYGATLVITHNDTSQASPQSILIDFRVAPCLCHGDPQCDGVLDVLDVTEVVDEAFRGGTPVTLPTCPHASKSDVNCDCVVDVLDVVNLIGWAFRGIGPSVCDPCARPCL